MLGISRFVCLNIIFWPECRFNIMKKFYRIVSLALCLVFAIGQTAFANTVESPERIIEIETIDEERGGSYTYVDLGTRTEYGSVEAVNASVSLLTGLIVGTLFCSPVAAKKQLKSCISSWIFLRMMHILSISYTQRKCIWMVNFHIILLMKQFISTAIPTIGH